MVHFGPKTHSLWGVPTKVCLFFFHSNQILWLFKAKKNNSEFFITPKIAFKRKVSAWKFKLLLLLMQRKHILARKFKFYVLQEKKSIFSILQSRNYSWAFFSFWKVTYSIVANNVRKLPKLSHFKQNCWFFLAQKVTLFLKNVERYNNETFWLIF